jgi:hypothetical protein
VMRYFEVRYLVYYHFTMYVDSMFVGRQVRRGFAQWIDQSLGGFHHLWPK